MRFLKKQMPEWLKKRFKHTRIKNKDVVLKSIIFIIGISLIPLAVIAEGGTNNFPTSLNNYQDGDIIPSGWARALESKIGVDNSTVTSSLDYQVNHIGPLQLATSTPPSDEYCLTYESSDSTFSWQDCASVIALDNLTDVTITSAASGDFLQYNGSAWVNQSFTQKWANVLSATTTDALAEGSRNKYSHFSYPFTSFPAFGANFYGTTTPSVFSGGIVSTGTSTFAATTTFAGGLNISSILQLGSDFITSFTGGGDLVVSSNSLFIGPNSVALGTDTSGNYVRSIADAGNTTISVSGSGSEDADVTLDVIGLNCTDCLGTTQISDIYLLNNASDETSGTLTANNFSVSNATATSTFGNLHVQGNAQIDGLLFAPIKITSSGNLVAGGTVTASNYVATSTTATSTFAGGLTIDGTDFVVDPDAGRVGIGTLTPSGKLTISEAGDPNIHFIDGSAHRLTVSGDSINSVTTNRSDILISTAGSSFTGLNLGSLILQGRSDGSGTRGDIALFPGNKTSPSFIVKNDGFVGIGTTSPQNPLHIYRDPSGALGGGGYTTADGLVVENDTGTGISIFTGSSYSGTLKFGDNNSPNSGSILYNHATDSLRFSVNGSERFRVDSSGNFGIATTSLSSVLTVKGDVRFGEGNNYDGFFFDATNARLGLGDSTPDAPLDISSDTAVLGIFERANTSGDAGITFTNTADTFSLGHDNNLDNFTITSGSDLTSNHLFNIDRTTGNVGVNQTAPADQFQITDGSGHITFGTLSGANAGLTFQNAAVAASNYSLLGNGTDTFVSRPSGGVLQFREANSTQVTLDTGGNFGIGTSSPSSPLTVNGDVRFAEGNNYYGLVYNATYGNLAIGGPTTNTGYRKFYVASTSSETWTSALAGNLNTSHIAEIRNLDSTDDTFAALELRAGGSNGAEAFIAVVREGGNQSALTFATENTSGNYGEHLRITSVGNIGIGTSSPFRRLSVDGSGWITGDLRVVGTLDSSDIGFTANGQRIWTLTEGDKVDVGDEEALVVLNKAGEPVLVLHQDGSIDWGGKELTDDSVPSEGQSNMLYTMAAFALLFSMLSLGVVFNIAYAKNR